MTQLMQKQLHIFEKIHYQIFETIMFYSLYCIQWIKENFSHSFVWHLKCTITDRQFSLMRHILHRTVAIIIIVGVFITAAYVKRHLGNLGAETGILLLIYLSAGTSFTPICRQSNF